MTHPKPVLPVQRAQAWRLSTVVAAAWLLALTTFTAIAGSLNRVRPARREERGDVIVQHLGVILLGIVALAAMFVALQALNVDVIAKIRTILGL